MKLNVQTRGGSRLVLAIGAWALFGIAAGPAMALSLGRISLQSTLGEPLRAEVEVPDISDDETASLRAVLASPAAYATAGLEYSAAVADLQVNLLRRDNGRAYLRLTGSRSITEPFVNLLVEVSWSSGRIMRDYTVLMDPPQIKAPATVASAPVLPVPAPTPAAAEKPNPVADGGAAEAAGGKAAAARETAGATRIIVKPGDTAGQLALRYKAAGVSTDQMLIAMLRANPQAFSRSNLNRLRAGAVLHVPGESLASATPRNVAVQEVIVHSQDFNELRRNVAANAPTAKVLAGDRAASGAVEEAAPGKKPDRAAPDKLTLSKGTAPSKVDVDALARERASKEASTREAEIAKNISDLNKLGAGTAKAAASVPQAGTSAPTAQPPGVDIPVAAPLPAASAPASSPAPAKPKTVVKPAPVEAPGLLDEWLADPLLPAAGLGVAVLLGAGLWLRRRQKNKAAEEPQSSFLDSHLQQDSVQGPDDLADAKASTQVADAVNQIDADDVVDPIAEADVYLNYGRHAEAQDILREAIRQTPQRLDVRVKLLEIVAKHGDAAEYFALASDTLTVAGEQSPQWAVICEMGRSIDPGNPLYGGTAPDASATVQQRPDAAAVAAISMPAAVTPPGATLPELGTPVDLEIDLDLDFSTDQAETAAVDPLQGALDSPPAGHSADGQQVFSSEQDGSFDFDIADLQDPPTPALDGAAASDVAEVFSLEDPAAVEGIDFEVPDIVTPAQEAVPVASADDGMLEFDLSALSLDLDSPATAAEDAESAKAQESLDTKFALAEEFVAIGDQDGARGLLEEVIAEARGELKERAQRALLGLG